MKRAAKILGMTAVVWFLGGLVLEPEICMAAAKTALSLCAAVVVPSLFPFLVCSKLFVALGGAKLLGCRLSPLMRPLFGISGSGALAVVLGSISGYPVGAECAAALYASGDCTKNEAERMLAFCNNTGPLFAVGAVGVGMFGRSWVGWMLYAIHILSAMLTGMLLRRYRCNTKEIPLALPSAEKPHSSQTVGGAVRDSVTAVLNICGYVVLCSVASVYLPHGAAGGLLHSMLEITGGIAELVQTKALGRFLLPTVSFFLAFSGVSVIMQVHAAVRPHGLSLKPYIIGKSVQGILAFLLTEAVLTVVPVSVPTYLPMPSVIPQISPKGMLMLSGLALGWCGLFLVMLTATVWVSERLTKHRKKTKK